MWKTCTDVMMRTVADKAVSWLSPLLVGSGVVLWRRPSAAKAAFAGAISRPIQDELELVTGREGATFGPQGPMRG
jgi:hypothetical protein